VTNGWVRSTSLGWGMPADSAMTQNNRATAFQSLCALSGDAAALRRPVEGYDEALTVHTRAAMPADGATAQNNSPAMRRCCFDDADMRSMSSRNDIRRHVIRAGSAARPSSRQPRTTELLYFGSLSNSARW